ncbi:MAG: hypothetical protein ABSF44_02205 [Candidatus Bathyarchaeia archaeon]|jgi:hypothetical protein
MVQLNIKALVVLTLLTILGISTGVYAYSNYVSVQDSYVQINGSNVTISDSNVTITNSTITLGEGNTIIYPTQTPTTSPVNSSTTNSPEITSVSLICAAQSQTITIQGNGFGDIQPQLMSLGDGSVDTVWGGSTPSIVVLDERNLLSAGAAGAWSGFTNGPPDLIGVILVSWNDTRIVLGGFGSGLGSQFSWSEVLKGDALQIQIQTSSGFTAYNTAAS